MPFVSGNHLLRTGQWNENGRHEGIGSFAAFPMQLENKGSFRYILCLRAAFDYPVLRYAGGRTKPLAKPLPVFERLCTPEILGTYLSFVE